MPTEIERKFLVCSHEWKTGSGTTYRQGYLSRTSGRTVRVRIAGAKAFLTIKGAVTGISRPEFEYEIPIVDAEQLLLLCDGPIVEKTRHLVLHAGAKWEVDEFHGDNAGLIVAELELQSEDQAIVHPPWLGREVTAETRYANSMLSVRPFSCWSAEERSS